MEIDLELYRREVWVSTNPPVQLSLIDIAPEHPRHTIVFIHGYGGDATQWQYQLNTFSSDQRVIALDLRGHGQSDQPGGDYSMARILIDLERALDVLGVAGKIVLVGHSSGGNVTVEAARPPPQRPGYPGLCHHQRLPAYAEGTVRSLLPLDLPCPRHTLAVDSAP